MSDKRLFLHIGTHKTGTTSFQHALAANEAVLAERGVALFWDGPNKLAAHRTADALLRRELFTGYRYRRRGQAVLTEENRAAFRARVAREIAALPERDVVLSAEGFSFLHGTDDAARAAAFLRETGRAPVILWVDRKLADWRRSWRGQLAKTPEMAEEIEGLTDAERPDGDWYFQPGRIAAFWRDLGRVERIDYDAAMAAEGSILPALLEAMELSPEGLDLEYRLNEGGSGGGSLRSRLAGRLVGRLGFGRG